MQKTFLQFLSEARKNPDLNPKTSINQEISDYVATGDPDSVYVSFTELEKLGINPSSMHNTPIGIYAYPVAYIQGMTSGGARMTRLPFAGDAPFANLFRAEGNFLFISEMSQSTADDLTNDVFDVWKQISKHKDDKLADQRDKIISQSYTNAIVRHLPGGKFWYITKMIATLMAKKFKGSISVQWNKLFRLIGIDGVVDNGGGIIHSNEPTQAVFFTTNVISDTKRVINKYSPEHIESSEYEGGRRQRSIRITKRNAQAMTDSQLIAAFLDGDDRFDVEDLNFLKDRPQVRIGVIRKDPTKIEEIENPTVEEQAVAIGRSSMVILNLAGRGILSNKAVEIALRDALQKSKQNADLIASDIVRSLVYKTKFRPSDPVLIAMIDADLDNLRRVARQKLVLISKPVVRYAMNKAGDNIPEWLNEYIRMYKLR